MTPRICLFLIQALFLAGCAELPDHQGIDITAATDAGVDVIDSSADMGEGGLDAAGPDSGSQYDWMVAVEARCDEVEEVSYPAPPFYPDFTTESAPFGGIVTKDQVDVGSLPFFGTLRGLPPNPKTRRIGTLAWLVSEETSLEVSGAAFTNQPVGSSTRFIATAMSDYQVVDARWTWYDAAGDSVESTKVGSGVVFEFDQEVETFSVEFPYESFAEHGYHELVVTFIVVDTPLHIGDNTWRFGVWNQSPDRNPHPCFEQKQKSARTPREAEVPTGFNGFAEIISYAPNFPNAGQEGVDLEVGESVDINYFVRGVSEFAQRPYRAVFYPTVNGSPVGPPSYIYTEKTVDWSRTQKEIVYRTSFTFTPDEPGTYEIGSLMVRNPWIAEVAPDGLLVNPTGLADSVVPMNIQVRVQ